LSRAQNRVGLTVFTLGALGVLIALGVWQSERRSWKNDLIARFSHALSTPPTQYEPPRPVDASAREFMRVKASGEFENDKTIKLLIATPQAARAQTQEGFGYLIFTPLKFSNGTVFVNRGFVPTSQVDNPQLYPTGQVTVTGIVRHPEPAGWFIPEPEPSKRLFYTADIPAMAAADGLRGDRVVVSEYIEADTTPGDTGWPMGHDPRQLLNAIPNRHLEYALTWFGLALALVCVYGFYIARN
jgi:surfeit locus 1 family protein